MRVALVHDWLNQYGGAERVLEVLHEMYPAAPVFTSLYAPERLPETYRRWDIRTSFMQRLPLAKAHHQPFLPLYPLVFERLHLDAFDLVISNSSGFCHLARTGPHTLHVNYCLTPPRFLWNLDEYLARERMNGAAKRAAQGAAAVLRRRDAAAGRWVDEFVGISTAVRDRIRRCYGRDATVIYPPVDTDEFRPVDQPDEFYLVAARLVPYKRVDLAVRTFTQLGLPLVVLGDGRDLPALRRMAGPTVRFEGWVSRERLRDLYARCRAFLFPAEEDFGIAPVEAQAAGRPVIAYAAGGALDTVVDGVTGVLFREQTPEALAEAVRVCETRRWDPAAIRENARRFDVRTFRETFTRFVEERTRQRGPEKAGGATTSPERGSEPRSVRLEAPVRPPASGD